MKTLALLLLFTGSCAAMENKVESKSTGTPFSTVLKVAFESMQEQRTQLKTMSLKLKELPAGDNKAALVHTFTQMVENFAARAQENMRDCTVHHIKLVRAYKREIKLALQTLNNL